MAGQPLDQLFRAFADENRLRILSLLSKGEICVCDIMSVLKMPQPKVSRHLAYLRRTGLVMARREGQWMYYSLAKADNGFHKKLLSCLDDCFDEAPIFKRDHTALKSIPQRSKVCC